MTLQNDTTYKTCKRAACSGTKNHSVLEGREEKNVQKPRKQNKTKQQNPILN